MPAPYRATPPGDWVNRPYLSVQGPRRCRTCAVILSQADGEGPHIGTEINTREAGDVGAAPSEGESGAPVERSFAFAQDDLESGGTGECRA